MNKEYIKALSIAEKTLREINKIYENVDNYEFEDIKACQAIERFKEEIESFTSEIRHYSKDIKEGSLTLASNGRYSLNDIELTCGYPLEVYNSEHQGWEAGKVEHSSKYGGYYFYNYDGSHKPLFDGMKVRIRV